MGLSDELGRKVLIADGAMGTLLYQFGTQRSHEELNISHPDTVKIIHQKYIDAGADIIQTNTYAANSLKLERYGLQNQVQTINHAAVRLAKEAVAAQTRPVYVLGTIGGIYSPGERKLNEVSLEQISTVLKEQLNYLLLAGVDGILLETYYDTSELIAAIKTVRAATALPIVANLTMQEIGVAMNGETFAATLDLMEKAGANVVGANCLMGPSHMAQAFQAVPLKNGRILSAYPNASLPSMEAGQIVYEKTTAHFEHFGEIFRLEGIGLIGGCCGTTPEHIRAIKKGLQNREIIHKKILNQSIFSPIKNIKRKSLEQRIDQKVRQELTILVELDPPRTLDTRSFFEGVTALKEANVDKITISDNSLARPRISNLALAAILKKDFDLSPLVHLTTRDHNLIGITSQIMGLHELNLFDVLALTGDPAKVGDFPGASSVFDTTSMGLIKLIKQFNHGISYTGKHLKETSDFKVGAAFNPNAPRLERAARVMRKKQDAGADYIVTQPIYDQAILPILKQSLTTYDITIPVFIGIQPLVSSRNAEFIHNEVPGIQITDEIRQQMIVADRQNRGKQEGLKIARQMIDEAKKYFNGFYLVTPFQNYQTTVELSHYLRQKETVK